MTAQPSPERPVVETTAGAVRGFRRPGSSVFLGVPYAEPPFGDLRFRAPEPRVHWSGVLDTVAYGPTPQRRALAEVTAIPEPSIAGDDVLSLNVFAPRPGGSAGDGDLPVLVYIHGGGYVAGSPASPWYDGAAFNRDGVVVVTIAYRLGFEGFGWLPDAPVNRGALDWVLALEWVRDNIAAFGGDPARVTVVGQSAGGGAVMTLLAMPSAQGLFAGAAALSAAPADIPLAAAELTTVDLADRLGIPADRAGFAKVTEQSILEAIGDRWDPLQRPTAQSLLAVIRGRGGLRTVGPVVDGKLLPDTVAASLSAGAGHEVPLLLGYTRDEFSGLAHAHRELFDRWDPMDLLDQLGVDPGVARRYLTTMPAAHAADVLGRYTTDLVFRRHLGPWVEARRGAAPTYVYDFAWPSGVSGLAGHCLDVPFVFDCLTEEHVARLAGPAAPQALADTVHGAYAAFVRTGSPGWPAHDDGDAVMVFDDPSGMRSGTYDSARVLATRP